jgi:hypothetical protein
MPIPAYDIRQDLAAIHAAQIDALGDPGAWWSGPQRIALAEAARQAPCEAGVVGPAEPRRSHTRSIVRGSRSIPAGSTVQRSPG